jgi:hypothetical protein
VFGDHGQKWMLFTVDQGGQRAHRAPHLLAFARATSSGPRRSQPHCGIEPVQDRLRQLPQLGSYV